MLTLVLMLVLGAAIDDAGVSDGSGFLMLVLVLVVFNRTIPPPVHLILAKVAEKVSLVNWW